MGHERTGGRIGTLFAGRFRIEALLGQGGFGSVYLARHTVLKRRFALKLLRRGFTADAETIGRFRREARAASLIDNPHVAYVFDFGYAEDGTLYIAMEYVEGTTLARVLAREAYLSLERSLDILAQVAMGLSAAHQRNVIHRDIKPENIALAAREATQRGDFVKILDFGLAKVVGADRSGVNLSRSDVVLGTAEYIAPEHYSGTSNDPRSDLYSVGVLAFELLVGRAPFEGKALDVLAAHLHQAPEVPSQAAQQQLPQAVDHVVLRCLAKQPSARYADADELLGALTQLQSALGFRSSLEVEHQRDSRGARSQTPTSDSESHGFATELTQPEWPGQRDADRDGGRARDVQALAFELCDSGVADDALRRALVRKLICEADLLAVDSAIALLESEAVEHGRSLTQQSTQLRHASAQLQALADAAELAEQVGARQARVSEALKQRVVEITEVVDGRREQRRALLGQLRQIEGEIVEGARELRERGELDTKLAQLLDAVERS